MSVERRREMVGREPHKLSLSRRCRLLGIDRGSLYYRPKGESPENLALMRRIDEQYLKTPWYGARQMARTSPTFHLRTALCVSGLPTPPSVRGAAEIG